MSTTTTISESTTRAQLAKEAAYRLLAKGASNTGAEERAREIADITKYTPEDDNQLCSSKDTFLKSDSHDTKAYLLVATLSTFWLALITFSDTSKNEACVAATIGFLRVAAIAAIIYVLDWYSTSLLGREPHDSRSRCPRLARIFALSLLFVMFADGMRVDSRALG